MIDSFTRVFLAAILIVVIVVAVVVLRRTRRPSRRGAVIAMFPTLGVWLFFELWLLAGLDLEAARWVSRVGVVSLAATLTYQLWSINYAEQAEEEVRTRL